MTAMHTNNPTTITRLRAALAQTSNDQRCKLATFSTEDETYRPDCDSTWLDIRALSGLARLLVAYASRYIDSLPPEIEVPVRLWISNETSDRLWRKLRALEYRSRDLRVSDRLSWVLRRFGCTMLSMNDCMEVKDRAHAHALLREHVGEHAVALYESNEADNRTVTFGSSQVWASAEDCAVALAWALDHVDDFLAWLPERLAKVELMPELVDIADRAAQHSATYREARLSFRRTYGRQPRKAELASLGPWMRHVERYRARAEQLCAGRPELLRWYIDHVDIVVDAPSWSDPAVAGSRALGLRLLARSNESNHARTAVA